MASFALDTIYAFHIFLAPEIRAIIDNCGSPSEMVELPVAERIQSFAEVDQALTEDSALKESNRCLFCGRLCYNMNNVQQEERKESRVA